MFRVKNWIQEKMHKKEGKFLRYLKKSQKFSRDEKHTIEKHIHVGKVKNVSEVFFIFLVWSGVFSILDVIIFFFSVVTSYVQGSPNFWAFFAFLILNGVAKLWYAHFSLPNFHWYDKALATLPYIGAGMLLAKGLKNDPLTRKALWMFLKKQL